MIRDLELAFATEHDVPDDDAWLSDRERAVLDKLHVGKRRNDWRVGRWTAKRAARRIYGAGEFDIIAAADGAPQLYVNGAPARCISISHSHGVGMSAIARDTRVIGCDIEKVAARTVEFVHSYFTPCEIAFVEALAAHEQPIVANAIWSAKESVLKAARVGLRRDTRDVEIGLLYGHGWRSFTGTLDGTVWRGVWRLYDQWVHTLVMGPL